MTSLLRSRHLRVAGMALGAVAVAAAAVVVTASASGMSFGLRQPASTQSNGANLTAAQASASSAACSSFMAHFAVEIKKSQAEINAAFQKAISDTLADQVKSGQLTQTQADAIKKKLANQTPCNLPSTIGHPSNASIEAYMQQYLTAAAAALGLTDAQLKADQAGGQSLSQIAAAKNIKESDFRTKLINNLKPTLDKAVTDKKLTSQQETLILQKLRTGPLPLWNVRVHKPKPAATATPATT